MTDSTSSNAPVQTRKRQKNRRSVGRGPTTTKGVSHALSWALRHAALDIGLEMTPAGWVQVQQVLESQHPRLRGISLPLIEEVVHSSDKKRFALSMRPRSDFHLGATSEEDRLLCIRANQGHSITSIDPEQLFTKLSPDELRNFPCIVHGTNEEAWPFIQQQGLKTMNRTHIHFATGLPNDDKVISGMRHSATIYIYLDMEACIRDDVNFYISSNGVILTDGADGVLSPGYFSKVTNADGECILKSDDH